MDERKRYRVLIIDDSALSRQVISDILGKSPHLEVVGTAADGGEAIQRVPFLKPDLITLDLEMPGINGFTFLRWLMKHHPVPTLVVSSQNNVKSVLTALELGAVDFMSKPTIGVTPDLFHMEENLLKKVETIVRSLPGEKLSLRAERLTRHDRTPVLQEPLQNASGKVELVVIGASTGGPPAVQTILYALPKGFPVPLVVVQHMPEGYTGHFAERLNRGCALEVKEATDQEGLRAGTAYIAPGGRHLVFRRIDREVQVGILNRRPEDLYTPSVDITLKSAAKAYGPKVLGIVLTGMGTDGALGLQAVKSLNGLTLAESEETAVIFGMPREAIRLGGVDRVLPLYDIPQEILALCLSPLSGSCRSAEISV